MRFEECRGVAVFAESSALELWARVEVLRGGVFFDEAFFGADFDGAGLSAEAEGFFFLAEEDGAVFFVAEAGASCAAKTENGVNASQTARKAARRRADAEVGDGTDLIIPLYDALPERRARRTSRITGWNYRG